MAVSVRELKAVANHLLSTNRQNKALILMREFVMQLLPAAPSLGTSERPVDPPPQKWRHSQATKIDPDFFNVRTKPTTEDWLGEDGLVHIDFNHEVHCLYGASSYTNESTHRTIFDRDGQRIERLSYRRHAYSGPSRLRIKPKVEIAGTTVNLYSTTSCAEGNYAHWLVDALANLFLVERFHSLDAIDHVLVAPLKYDFQWDSLAAFGFGPEQIVELPALECLQFERLLATSAPRGESSSTCPVWAIERYRQVLLQNAANVPSIGGKKIYVSRRDAPSRKFLNEDEVCSFLESRGFDIVELAGLNLNNKIAVFRDAKCIVGQTGAGLTNLMFSTEGSVVLELVDHGFVYDLYSSIAASAGVRHVAHFFDNHSVLGKINAQVAQSTLDLNQLEQSLKKCDI